MQYTLKYIHSEYKENTPVEDIYDLWLKAVNSFRHIDSAWSEWFVPLRSSSIKKFVPITEKKTIIRDSIKQTKEFDKEYDGKGWGSFEAWSINVSPNGPTSEEKKHLAKMSYFSGSAQTKGNFSLELRDTKDKDKTLSKKMRELIQSIAKTLPPVWVSVAPDKYMISQCSFPHREWVGWMALVPDVDLSNEMPFVALAEYLPGIGTLIVTTKEPFDPENEEHIKLARATEVFLADRELLPERGI